MANKVYLVHHSHYIEDDMEDEDLKFIGVFSSREKAVEAVKSISDQPGFSTYPKILNEYGAESGFFIEEHSVGK